jgi:hypothetical protein
MPLHYTHSAQWSNMSCRVFDLDRSASSSQREAISSLQPRPAQVRELARS